MTRLMLWYAVALHAVIGLAVLIDPRAINITTLHEYTRVGHPRIVAVVLLVAAGCAVVGAHSRWRWLLLPQQAFLVVSAVGALSAMAASAFGDGVVRPRMFLIADQAPAVFAAVFHTLAVVRLALEERR